MIFLLDIPVSSLEASGLHTVRRKAGRTGCRREQRCGGQELGGLGLGREEARLTGVASWRLTGRC